MEPARRAAFHHHGAKTPIRKRGPRIAVLIAVACAAAMLIGVVAAVIAAGLLLSAPDRSQIGPPPPQLAAADAVTFASASGAVIRGWWLPGTPNQGVVLLLHGVHSDRRSMVRRAEVLHARGFAVLLFDFQAEGESSGDRITFGAREALDAVAATDFVKRHAPNERVGALGVSLGGASILLGPAPLPVQAVVLESVFPTIEAAIGNRLRTALGPKLGPIAAPVLEPLFIWLLPPILQVRPDQLQPIAHIGQMTAPLLLLSGANDTRTPIDEAASLFARAPEPKEFHPIPGADHVDLERHDPALYWTIVLPFLERHLHHE